MKKYWKKRNKRRRVMAMVLLAVFCIEIFTPTVVWATNGPTSPEASSFAPAGDQEMVDLFTGDFKYNIPLLDIEGYPINLSYSSSGINSETPASWVGLGWTLNPGSVSRSLNGLPDDFNGDEVTKVIHQKENQRWRASGASNIEFFGFQPSTGSNLNIGIKYDNILGIGFDLSFENATDNSPLELNFGYDSYSGFNTGLTIKPKGTNFEISGGFSGSSGLTNLAVSGGGDYKAGMALNMNNSFPTTSPQIEPEMEITNLLFGLTLGASVLGTDFDFETTGTFFESKIKDNNLSAPSFGYYYFDHSMPDEAILDINREGSTLLTRDARTMTATQYGIDRFSVSGNGIGGSFRAYRNDIGVVGSPSLTYSNESEQVGIEASGGSGLGANLAIGYSRVESGKLNNLWQQWKGWSYPSNSDEQNVFFRSESELHVNNSSENTIIQYASNARPEAVTTSEAVRPIITGFYPSYSTAINKNGSTRDFTQQTTHRKFNVANSAFQPYTAYQRSNIGNTNFKNHPHYELDNTGGIQSVGAVTNIAVQNSIRQPHHFSRIDVTGEGGQRYVYGVPVYAKANKSFSFSVSSANASLNLPAVGKYMQYDINLDPLMSIGTEREYYSEETKPGYAQSFLLTEVQSPDYVDVTLDGPTSDDLGNVHEFKYTRTSENFKWRAPYGEKLFAYDEGMEGVYNDDMGSVQYGEKEIWYLSEIHSKNFVAVFVLANRMDDKPVVGINGGKDSQDNSSKRLVRIELYNSVEYKANKRNATPIKTVHFKYDYSLVKNTPDNSGASLSQSEYYTTSTNHKGKLTLKEVYFTYGNSQRSEDEGYRFEYNGLNPDYGIENQDHWGTYSNGYSNHIYPYTIQDGPTIDQWSSAWCLTDIYTPMGGRTKVEYESDQYRYVQDDRAMYLANVVGTGTSNEVDTNALTNTAFLEKGLGVNITQDYIYIKLPRALTSQQELEDIFRGIGKFYYKFYTNGASSNNMWVTGYLNGSVGFCEWNNQLLKNYIYIKVDKVPVVDNGLPDTHPASRAGYRLLSDRALPLLFPSTSPSTSNNTSVFTFLIDAVGQMTSFITSPYVYMKSRNIASRIYLNRQSRIRIPVIDSKYGGGNRVRRITQYDLWDQHTQMGIGNSYIMEYKYVTEDGQSSGVCTTEPSFAGEENPYRKEFIQSSGYRFLAPDQPVYLPHAPGESMMPGPNVGYSRVVKEMPNPNGYQNQGIGKVVNEFYTAKDFPVIFDRTKLASSITTPHLMPINPLAEFFNVEEAKSTFVQGISVQTNDMHGKPKADWVYAEGMNSPLSGTEYKYKLNKNGSSVSSTIKRHKHLNNEAITLLGGEKHTSTIGTDVDVVIDANSHYESTTTPGLRTNINFVGIWPIPGIPIPKFSLRSNTTRTSVISKHYHQKGVMDSIITYDQGAMLRMHNVAHDWKSGSAIITSQTNEHNERNYTTNLPAHWAYPQMGFASEAQLTRLTLSQSSTPNRYSVSSASELVTEGDVVFYHITNQGSPVTGLAWVNDINAGEIQLVGENGSVVYFQPDNQAINYMIIVQSGRTNMFSSPLLTVVSEEKPWLIDPMASLNSFDNVISTKAVEYSESGTVYCDKLNRNDFLNGERGRWYPERDWIINTERNHASSFKKGYFSTYSPFWSYSGTRFDFNRNPAGWTWRTMNYATTPFGQSRDVINALGKYSSQQYGYGLRLPEASFQNAGSHEILFESFDSRWYSGEQPIDLANYVKGDWVTGVNPTNNEAHTGNYSLEIPSNGFETITFNRQNCQQLDCIDIDMLTSLLTNKPPSYFSDLNALVTLVENAYLQAFSSQTVSDKMREHIRTMLLGMIDTESDSWVYQEICYPVCPCESQPSLSPGKEFRVYAWVKGESYSPSYENFELTVNISGGTNSSLAYSPTFPLHPNVDEWQLVWFDFLVPKDYTSVSLTFSNNYSSDRIWIDDVRVQPVDASGVCQVYDPSTLRLVAEFDDQHFPVIYNYDKEGKLTRTHRVTREGQFTLQENNYHRIQTQ